MRTLEQHVETIVVGGGQAGLSVGYQLARRGLPFVILDAGDRIGDSWRGRWDSLRLFTPARYDGLAGMRFPAPRHSYPTKEAMADYLEAYATRFELPVRLGVHVDRVARNGTGFVVTAGERRFLADNVVVAIGSWQCPRVPAYAAALNPAVVQLHSVRLSQRGAAPRRATCWSSAAATRGPRSRSTRRAAGAASGCPGGTSGHIPIRIDSFAARFMLPLILRGLFHRVLTTRTPMGRRKRPDVFAHGLPLVRTKPEDLAAAGIERVPRVTGVARRAARARGRPRDRRGERRLVHGIRPWARLARHPRRRPR